MRPCNRAGPQALGWSAEALWSYDPFLLPSAVKELEVAGERWFPLEVVSSVHEESSLLAFQARSAAIAQRENLVIDTVLSSPEKAAALGQMLTAAGYTDVRVVDVEATYAQSQARTWHRWERGYRQALQTPRPLLPRRRAVGPHGLPA